MTTNRNRNQRPLRLAIGICALAGAFLLLRMLDAGRRAILGVLGTLMLVLAWFTPSGEAKGFSRTYCARSSRR
jgi:drug/metabolite transporter superfamily protein YnfA